MLTGPPPKFHGTWDILGPFTVTATAWAARAVKCD